MTIKFLLGIQQLGWRKKRDGLCRTESQVRLGMHAAGGMNPTDYLLTAATALPAAALKWSPCHCPLCPLLLLSLNILSCSPKRKSGLERNLHCSSCCNISRESTGEYPSLTSLRNWDACWCNLRRDEWTNYRHLSRPITAIHFETIAALPLSTNHNHPHSQFPSVTTLLIITRHSIPLPEKVPFLRPRQKCFLKYCDFKMSGTINSACAFRIRGNSSGL